MILIGASEDPLAPMCRERLGLSIDGGFELASGELAQLSQVAPAHQIAGEHLFTKARIELLIGGLAGRSLARGNFPA